MKGLSKVIKYIIIAILAIIVLAIAVFALLLFHALKQPAVPKQYYENQTTGGEIEAAYARMGTYRVSEKEYDAGTEDGKQRHFKVWYPELEGTYPLIVMVNGTGIPYQKYEEVFQHLASWGFVVIGNDYEKSWDGVSSAASLDFALTQDEISRMVDLERIGVGGHSQGGLGAFNAVLEQENGWRYKVLFSISPTSSPLAVGLEWSFHLNEESAYGYDLSQLTIPVLMFAGTGEFDANTVIPLDELRKNFDTLPNDILKIAARRKDTEHGDMLWRSDPYVTAWLMYHLYGDEYAGKAFSADEGELFSNTYWQDCMSSN